MEKVPGGKLLRIKVEHDDKIKKVQILGDFFAHPEHSINEIESYLEGLDVDFHEQNTVNTLKRHIITNDYNLIGIDEAAIIRVLKKAIGEEE